MPLRKIEEPNEQSYQPKTCHYPEHCPPSHLYLEPGKYEWTCPACGETYTFYVTGATWASWFLT